MFYDYQDKKYILTVIFSLTFFPTSGTLSHSAAQFPAVRFGRGGDDIHANIFEAACQYPLARSTDGRGGCANVPNIALWRNTRDTT